MKIISVLVIVLAATSNFAVSAERTVTLEECVYIAVANNSSVRISNEDKKKALNDYRINRAQRSLWINAQISTEPVIRQSSAGVGSVVPPGIDSTFGLFAGVGATYSLINMKKSRGDEAFKSMVFLSKFQSRKAVDDVIYNVKEAFFNYMISRENTLLRERTLKLNSDKLRIARLLFKTGQRFSTDVSKAEMDEINEGLECKKAQNNQDLMKLKLLNIIGADEYKDELLIQKFDKIPVIKFSLQELKAIGEANSIDISILKMQKKIAKINIDVERAGNYPEVEIQFRAGVSNNKITSGSWDLAMKKSSWQSSISGGITAKIPIYTGGTISSKIESAIIDYNKLVYKEKEFYSLYDSMLRSNYITLEELGKQIEITKTLKENADKHYAVAKKSYEIGQSTILELNDAMLAIINSEINHITTKGRYLLTLAKLSQLVGLSEEMLCK